MSDSNPQNVQVKVVRDPNLLELPKYQTSGASAMDVNAVLPDNLPVTINPGKSAIISTGIKVAIPSGYEILVCPRSGLAAKNQITVLNTPGTIDSDYRGVIGVILINHSDVPFVVNPNDRIAQIKLVPVMKIEWVSVDTLDETERGEGSYGHTGK